MWIRFFLLVLLVVAGLGQGGAMVGTGARAETVAVARPVDETGRAADAAAEAFFAAADRRDAAAMGPAESCQEVFSRGLE